jgi:tetratricopeptide (TPR) repeat protein
MQVKPTLWRGRLGIRVGVARDRCAAVKRARRVVLGCVLVALCSVPLHSQDVRALTQQGLEYMKLGRFREAESPLLQALKLTGPDNPTAVYNLAALYHRQWRLSEAERLHRRALELIEHESGPLSLDVAQSLNDLGAVYRSLGKHSQAIGVLERAVGILDGKPSSELTVTTLNNLGAAYYEIGQVVQSEDVVRRALAIAESGQHGGGEVPYLMSALGRQHFARKQYADAETAHRRAISLLAGMHGVQHPDYAIALSNLAAVYQKQKRFPDAVPLLESAIEILEASVGRDASVLGVPLDSYSEVLRSLGRKSEAREVARRAKAIVRPGTWTVDVKALRQTRRSTTSY